MKRTKMLSLLLSIVMLLGLFVPAYAATNSLKLLSGKAATNSSKYGNVDVYRNVLDETFETISTGATYTWAEETGLGDTTKLTDGQAWSPSNWGNGQWLDHATLEKTGFQVTFDLKAVYELSRIDLHEAQYSQWNHVDKIEVSVGKSADKLTPITVEKSTATGAVTDTQNGRVNMLTFTPVDAQYVQINIIGADMYVQELMIFGDVPKENLTVLNAPISTNGVFSNKYIYANYLNANLTSATSGATYSWLPNAKSSEEAAENDIVSDITTRANANLTNGAALWCTPGYNYQVDLKNPELTYTLRFDLKDWYDINRVDVFEVNYVENEGVITEGVTDYSVAVGTRTDAMNVATIEKTATVLGDGTISKEHTTGKATAKTFTTALHGRYVDITFSVAGTAELQGVMIFGEKPEKKTLNSIGGPVMTNGGIYGALDVYPQYLDTTVTMLSNAATYTFTSGSGHATNLTDGNVWFSPQWGSGVWMTDEATTYKVLFDLKNNFEVNRVDVHEIANANNYLTSYNYINSFAVSVGSTPETLVPVETSFSRIASWDKNATIPMCAARANIAELVTPTEGRYVEVAITVGSDACLGEILIFGNSAEKTEYFLISPNTLTDADKTWYSKQQKINITSLDVDTTYQWATFGLEEKEAKNTIAPLVRRLDDDYNGDGIGGEKNVADGNVTSSDAEYVVPLTGVGNNAVIYDFGKKMLVNRVDVHEFVKDGTGLGNITVLYGDKLGAINKTAKNVNLTYTSAEDLTHKLNAIDLGTPVQTRFLAISFSMDDGNAGTTNTTGYVLGDILIFGEDAGEIVPPVEENKMEKLQKVLGEALAYDNAIPYDAEDWNKLQSAIGEAQAILNTDIGADALDAAINALEDAIYDLDLRGGTKLISQNVMENAEWTVFQERWPSIRQVVLENASARIMTAAEDGVTGADPSIVGDKVKELFDGGVKMYGGDSGVWSGWQNHGTTYVLYDFGEEVWINGADVASYDYKYYNNSASKFIGEIFVEVSNDGVNFTPAGSASAEEITGDDIGSVLERTTSVTFPAKKARYAKVGVTKGAGTIQYVLMEMWIRGIADFENKLTMTENADGSVTADVFLNSDEDNARIFLANYDKSGRFLGVKMSESLAGGVGDITVTGNIADGTVAKGMVMNSASGIKPLLPVKTVEKYTEKEFTLSNLFTDGGVLQRGKEVPVFGTATTGTEIIATVNGKEYKTVADGDGKWIVYADAVAAFDVVDISATDGESTFTAGEMLGGEVWLCSGQSNMMYTFDMLNSNELPDNLLEYENLRYFRVPVVSSDVPLDEVDGAWVDVSTLSETEARKLSALVLLSGVELSDYANVPVGVIEAARGGTSIEAFISQDGFAGKTARFYQNFLASQFYNGMIHPLVPYGIKGVFWYQGCQNHGNWQPNAYLDLQKAWMNDWRTKWNDDSLPFVLTMLAPWKDGNFAHIRDQQLAMRSEENDVGVISIMDLGDVDGVVGDNIHPMEKREVARRLVLTAQAVAYDEDVKHLFPVMKSVTVKADGSVDVVFDDVYDGLRVKEGDTTVTGFRLKVGDAYQDAVATITGKDIVNVKVNGVLAPSGVWYAYQGAINPELNLFHSEGLSAMPFCVDIQ